MTYSFVGSHRAMVFDDLRNELYARAIRNFVTPESVVLDLGAGLGIHGLIAAAAGAKHVYLVEPEPVVQIAIEAARANGLAGRITVLEGTIENVMLPEQVDLIVSVFAGNLLFTEDLLPSLFHARDHYLKPGGRLVPDLAELVLVPVSAPDIHAKRIGRWSEPAQGLDFSAARRFAANEILWPERKELQDRVEQLAEPAVLTALDLTTATSAHCQGEARCRIAQSGICHGLMGWIRMRLGDQWLSTDPSSPEVHWAPGLLPIDPPMPVEAGQEVKITLQRPARGDWTWTIASVSESRRHSSFLAHTDSVRRMRTLAPGHRPGLGQQGENTLRMLQLMREGRSNQEIAQALAAMDSSSPGGIEEALRKVQALALRYGKQA